MGGRAATRTTGSIRTARRAVTAVFAALAVTGALAGCSGGDDLAQQYRDGDNKGFIAGDGTYVEIPPDRRGQPVVFSGDTVDGAFDSAEHDGQVLVVNFWYAGCAPCRAEAPILAELSGRLDPAEASLVGINIRDGAGQAAAFDEKFGLDYPSILDVDSGLAQLAFAGDVPPNAVPTTIVLDREHRIAARVLGQISDASIIGSMVDTVLGER